MTGVGGGARPEPGLGERTMVDLHVEWCISPECRALRDDPDFVWLTKSERRRAVVRLALTHLRLDWNPAEGRTITAALERALDVMSVQDQMERYEVFRDLDKMLRPPRWPVPDEPAGKTAVGRWERVPGRTIEEVADLLGRFGG